MGTWIYAMCHCSNLEVTHPKCGWPDQPIVPMKWRKTIIINTHAWFSFFFYFFYLPCMTILLPNVTRLFDNLAIFNEKHSWKL